MKLTPMIAVRDVARSADWYGALVGCVSAHGGPEFDRLAIDGRTVLLLHRWGASLRDPDAAPAGHGVILWFQVDDLDAAWARAARLGARVIDPPRANVEGGHVEFTVADPDGYVVAVCAPTAS